MSAQHVGPDLKCAIFRCRRGPGDATFFLKSGNMCESDYKNEPEASIVGTYVPYTFKEG